MGLRASIHTHTHTHTHTTGMETRTVAQARGDGGVSRRSCASFGDFCGKPTTLVPLCAPDGPCVCCVCVVCVVCARAAGACACCVCARARWCSEWLLALVCVGLGFRV